MLGDSFQWINYQNSSQQHYDRWLNQNMHHSRYEAEYMRETKGLMNKAQSFGFDETLYFSPHIQQQLVYCVLLDERRSKGN